MKKAFVYFVCLVLLSASVVIADPTDYNKKASKGIYYLVQKDSSWNPMTRSEGAFGMAKFSIDEANMLTVRLVAHKLTAGNYYYVELVDKGPTCGDWDYFNPSNYAMFYGQADSNGNVVISFTQDIGSFSNVEINLKNAENVALLNPSAFGVPSEWILGTGQGWDAVLFGATTIPDACVYTP